jgi:serine/threonine protein kinase
VTAPDAVHPYNHGSHTVSRLPGTRLGSYEVLPAIGAGGMREVYRARDTRLNRDVAIKVLPELFAADLFAVGPSSTRCSPNAVRSSARRRRRR